MTSNAATEPVRPRVGPFAGVLIADLTHALSGPFCTMLLAELGARVVKVERPPALDADGAAIRRELAQPAQGPGRG